MTAFLVLSTHKVSGDHRIKLNNRSGPHLAIQSKKAENMIR